MFDTQNTGCETVSPELAAAVREHLAASGEFYVAIREFNDNRICAIIISKLGYLPTVFDGRLSREWFSQYAAEVAP